MPLPVLFIPTKRSQKRLTLKLGRWLCCMALLCPILAWPQTPDSNLEVQLTSLDSLIRAGEYEQVITVVNEVLQDESLDDSLWAEYQIMRLLVMRNIDQWDMLIFLSKDLLDKASLSAVALQRIRLLRAVARENLGMYAEAGAELDSLSELFGPNPMNRYYGEYLYRRASFYRVQSQDSLAMQWVQRALAFNEKEGHIKELATSEMVLAMLMKDGPEREMHFLRAAELNLEAGDAVEASMMYSSLAEILAQRGLPQAKVYMHKSLTHSTNSGPIFRTFVYRNASTVYERFGMLDSALYFFKQSFELNYSAMIIQQNSIVRINEAQRAFDDLDASRLAEEGAIRTAKQMTWLAVALGTALAMIVALLTLVSRQLLRIRRQRNELSERQEQLNILLHDKELLLKELHHRVKNQLTTVIAIIDHQLSREEELTKDQLRGIQQRIFAIARVHEALLHGVEEHSKLDGADIERIIGSLLLISERPVVTSVNVEKVEMDINKAVPLMMVMNELVMNTIKHNQRTDTKLHVELAVANNELVLRYSDNGTWITGNPEKENDGTGTYIINAMVKQLSGTLERTGTTYLIRFPQ